MEEPRGIENKAPRGVELAALTAAVLVAGCGSSGSTVSSGADGDTLTLWTHDAGNAAEYDVVK
ncbi:hypothetical protein ACWGKW_27320 [Streptomyces sp. NPDC054766]